MKKRLFSAILAMATAISTVTAISSNAALDYYWGSITDEAVAETFKDCVLLKDDNWLIPLRENEIAVYLDKSSCYILSDVKDYIVVNISLDYDVNEFIENLAEIDGNLKVVTKRELKDRHQLNLSGETISPETAKKIREKIGESVIDFTYNYNQMFYQEGCFGSLTEYTGNNDKEIELREYLEKNNIDAELKICSIGDDTGNGFAAYEDSMEVIPTKELTITEHYELAEGIYKELGLICSIISPTSANLPLGTSLDLTDYLDGDANRDKLTTIADAAAIFQSLANPDKYALSEQGIFNADSKGDGLTVDDAVAIQKKLAGIE